MRYETITSNSGRQRTLGSHEVFDRTFWRNLWYVSDIQDWRNDHDEADGYLHVTLAKALIIWR